MFKIIRKRFKECWWIDTGVHIVELVTEIGNVFEHSLLVRICRQRLVIGALYRTGWSLNETFGYNDLIGQEIAEIH